MGKGRCGSGPGGGRRGGAVRTETEGLEREEAGGSECRLFAGGCVEKRGAELRGEAGEHPKERGEAPGGRGEPAGGLEVALRGWRGWAEGRGGGCGSEERALGGPHRG